MNQQALGRQIAERLKANTASMKAFWESASPVRHCFLDELLPEETAKQIYHSLPDPSTLMLRESIKERKRVGIKVEDYAPEMEAILFAFQQPEVVEAVGAITGQEGLSADSSLYGSGISLMLEGDFLLPHLDNSHDGDGKLYRVLNLLYYITPEWPENGGGNLELWDKHMKTRKEIHSRFNRLVLMETHTDSVHSVTKVTQPGGMRACISNYYFSAIPSNHKEHVHKTTFFARPEDGLVKKIQLTTEGKAKNFLARFLKNDIKGTAHRRK
jgi:Rps23 Pro-64 3,4-dihydroxylase Tpa1-like proline 4-hydroxylase